jgi:hypothetical protein
MFTPLASQRLRIATAGSPAPRKIALFRNNRMITMFPPNMIDAYVVPVSSVSADAPIALST